MAKQRILVSWIGHADLLAMIDDLGGAGEELRKAANIGGKYGEKPGPLKISVTEGRFDLLFERSELSINKQKLVDQTRSGVVNEAFFMGGVSKTKILQRFKPHLFFDDQEAHCLPAESVVPTGRVPYGVKNKKTETDTTEIGVAE
jgi:hypothetical protein